MAAISPCILRPASASPPASSPTWTAFRKVKPSTAIVAQRPAPEQVDGVTWMRQERATGRFARVLALPFPVDAEKVEAAYTNGVLKVTLPKIAAVKPRTIPVKVSE